MQSTLHRLGSALPEDVKGILRRVSRRARPITEARQPVLPETGILGLTRQQLYPMADDLAPTFLDSRSPLIDRSTPVGSMGSCFAREIKDWLEANDYNYVQTSDSPAARHGSAAWDRVYNTFSIRQEFERAIGEFNPSELHWDVADGLRSPYRKNVSWDSLDEAASERVEHARSARQALVTSKLFILTLGLTEVWFSREDGSVYYQVPPEEIFDEARHGFRVSTFSENLENLRSAHSILQSVNPDCHLLVTVSPVPLRATFQKSETVLTANSRSKATLVAAARDFVDSTHNTTYFPSYELVTAVYGGRNAFHQDNRHVRREVVDEIMALFERNHVR